MIHIYTLVYTIYTIGCGLAFSIWGYTIRKNNNTYGLFFYDNSKFEKEAYCKIVGRYFFIMGLSYVVYGILGLFYSQLILTNESIREIYEIMISVTFVFGVIAMVLEVNSRARVE